MPRILICLAPFCLDAAVGALPDFFNGVVPVGFSSALFFSSLLPLATVGSLIPSVTGF
jgi:hypothetical protein